MIDHSLEGRLETNDCFNLTLEILVFDRMYYDALVETSLCAFSLFRFNLTLEILVFDRRESTYRPVILTGFQSHS